MNNIEFIKPNDLDSLLFHKGKDGGRGEILAGGTNLIPQIRAKSKTPRVLIDISDMKELSFIREGKRSISLGASTTMAEIHSSEIIKSNCPILALAARQLGNPLTRNRATIGGNLANASPAADTATPLLALEADIHLDSRKNGKRQIPLDEFFMGNNRTALKKNEIINRLSFKKPKYPLRCSYIKLGLRNAMAISLVTIAMMIEVEESCFKKVRIALGSVAPKPIRAYSIEKVLEGKNFHHFSYDDCIASLNETISPISDIRASEEYRRHAASVLFRRAIREALDGEKI